MRLANSIREPIFFQRVPLTSEFQCSESNLPTSISAYVDWISLGGEKGGSEWPKIVVDALRNSNVNDDRLLSREKVKRVIRYAFRNKQQRVGKEDGFFALRALSGVLM